MDDPGVTTKPIVAEQSHCLRLKLGNQLILIVLNQIHTVLPILALQSIPHDDVALAGMLNYHGQPVPVYHLSELLHIPKPQYDINALLLMSPLSSGLVGFLISEELDIITISEKAIQQAPVNKNMQYVVGLIENEAWSAWVLDLEKLLQFHQAEIEKIHA